MILSPVGPFVPVTPVSPVKPVQSRKARSLDGGASARIADTRPARSAEAFASDATRAALDEMKLGG